jgi:hypothetical protein
MFAVVSCAVKGHHEQHQPRALERETARTHLIASLCCLPPSEPLGDRGHLPSDVNPWAAPLRPDEGLHKAWFYEERVRAPGLRQEKR